MKTMTMQDRQTLASRYAAGENVTQIAVDLGMSAAAVYAELRRGYTGGLDGNKRREYDPELGLTRYQESLANRGRRNPTGDKRSRNDAGYSCGGRKDPRKGSWDHNGVSEHGLRRFFCFSGIQQGRSVFCRLSQQRSCHKNRAALRR